MTKTGNKGFNYEKAYEAYFSSEDGWFWVLPDEKFKRLQERISKGEPLSIVVGFSFKTAYGPTLVFKLGDETDEILLKTPLPMSERERELLDGLNLYLISESTFRQMKNASGVIGIEVISLGNAIKQVGKEEFFKGFIRGLFAFADAVFLESQKVAQTFLRNFGGTN